MEAMPLAEDLLEGGAAISAELGVPPRRAYRLLEKGAIPGFKLAGKWYARRSTLRARIADLERGEPYGVSSRSALGAALRGDKVA
jgi:hypothetical protein